ncbi:unnamed protein product [Protopolystoma xenopodis]|uniref:Uncharacterized protein n=1 Tax=Protopolystoma xenopodis TaxID=117903 RepID=A0A3S5CUP1_9PLAT|nr:unnamed protein product [Protopolystoma xenopodis]
MSITMGQTKSQHRFILATEMQAKNFLSESSNLTSKAICLRLPMEPTFKLFPANYVFQVQSRVTTNHYWSHGPFDPSEAPRSVVTRGIIKEGKMTS